MPPINISAKTLARSALDEALNLERNKIVDDGFLRQAIDDFQELITLSDAPGDLTDRMKAIGRVAVRACQSFDEIPEADQFVELCSAISQNIRSASRAERFKDD